MDSEDPALDLEIAEGDPDRLHRGVGRLKTSHSAGLAVKTLQCGFAPSHQRYDDLPVPYLIGPLDQDIVAGHDVVLDHGLAIHLEHVEVGVSNKVGKRKRL